MNPILLIGGSGVIGRLTAQLLHAAHPFTPLLIGGRDLVKVEVAESEFKGAEDIGTRLGGGPS